MTNDQKSFARMLTAEGPNPALEKELHLFGRFVGAWDLEWYGGDNQGRPNGHCRPAFLPRARRQRPGAVRPATVVPSSRPASCSPEAGDHVAAN